MSRAADVVDAQRDTGRLTVVVINDFASIVGGSDRVALVEATGLAKRGHRVTLVAGGGDPEPELIEAGVNITAAGQFATRADPSRARAAARGIWNRPAAALVRDALRPCDRKSTVVHVHGFTKVLSASVVRAAVDSGLPTVATLHEYFAACPNGAFFNYPRGEICHLTPLSPRCIATNCDARAYSHKLWRVARSAVQRQFGAMPSGLDQFVAPSRFTADILRPFIPRGAPLHVLPNPVAFERMAAANPEANSAFTFVGRLAHDKGAALFAQASRAAGVPAVFVGEGDEEVTIRRANPDAELLGRLAPAGVQSTMREARAVVHASLWYETQGLVPLEAAAQGVPTIVSDAGVPREAVSDGETGLWFRSGDVDDLAAKLTQLQRDPELAGRLGRAAYERFWSAQWDVDSHLDRLEEIYRAGLSS